MFNKKLISLCLAAAMTASAVPTSVFAASIGSSSADANIGEDTAQSAQTSYAEIFKNNNETQVYLTIDDKDRVVSLPTTVILSGTPDAQGKYIGKYSVGVSGDMSGKKIVKVEPEATASLTQRGKNNVTASIAQDQVSFNTDDFKNKTVTNGSISADSLTAGSWNSNFNFNVSTEVNSVPAGYTLLYKYDLSASTSDNVAAYYCVPNKNTEEIELNESSNTNSSLTSMISNLFSPMTVYASENNIIEYNGVKYTLSNEDKLIISGSGNMKENIQAELTDYKGIKEMTSQHFGIKNAPQDDRNGECFVWFLNDLHPWYFTADGKKSHEKDKEIADYINSIKNDFVVSAPKTIIIQDGVTNVSSHAFYNCDSIIDVTIPSSVTEIGEKAFDMCTSLKNVIISNGLKKIGDSAFNCCASLKNINIPNTVTYIDYYAFAGCTSLTEINLPNGITTIKNSAFVGCTSLKNINIPNTVTKIYDNVFEGCEALKQINIPNTVTEIGYNAFYGCGGLTSITVPNTVTTIGSNAFKGVCNINYSGSASGSTWGASYINKYAEGDLLYSDYNKTELLLCSKTTAKSIIIPNTVTTINSGAFYNRAEMSVTIPDTVTTIGSKAFYNVLNINYSGSASGSPWGASYINKYAEGDLLYSDPTKTELITCNKQATSINIPNGVTSIKDSAFFCYTKLNSITIPNSVTSVGRSAFMGVSNLTIYCQSQAVADLLVGKYDDSFTTVVVDASKF